MREKEEDDDDDDGEEEKSFEGTDLDSARRSKKSSPLGIKKRINAVIWTH